MATQEYPRPDFERTILNWQSLNGLWKFVFDDNDIGLKEKWQTKELLTVAAVPPSKQDQRDIIVPFTFQTPASGIHDRGVHEVIWYQRFIEDIRTEVELENSNRLLLRFGAVDYEATVWVNGEYVGFHRGGHVPFDLDITNALEFKGTAAKSFITVRVFDSAFNLEQPRGKQYWEAEPVNIFYTPSSGIWQSVWMESVPRARIADPSNGTILRSHDINSGQLSATISTIGRKISEDLSVEIAATLDGVKIGNPVRKTLTKENNHVDLDLSLRLVETQYEGLPKGFFTLAPLNNDSCWLNGLALWSPEHPTLYDIVIRLIDSSNNVIDEVKTTTGMRSTSWSNGDGTFKLNGKPYFQALVLDQGYWPETGMTPPSALSLQKDIQLAKIMGFNGCRKHQKVEDPIFLYWADKLGFLVWGEMANAYRFSNEYVERFDQEWMEAVRRDINHPCIVTWTPINESWGYTSLKDNIEQRNHIRSLYYMTK
jgi:beta-galactosidase/beta-glucuronidase